MQGFAEDDGAFFGFDLGVAHGDFPLPIPVNAAHQDLSIVGGIDFRKGGSGNGGVARGNDLDYFSIETVKMGHR